MSWPQVPSMPKALWAALMACALAHCGDPCRELSDAVCDCMPTRSQQQACRKRIHALAAQRSDSADKAVRTTCESLLATCTCEALAQGNLAACGLAAE